MIHARQLLLPVLGGIEAAAFLHPLGEGVQFQQDAAVRTAPALLHLADDAAGHVIARQQLGRPARILALELLAQNVEEALFLVVGRLMLVGVGNVAEHEAFALAVAQHAPLAADAFGDQDAVHAGRPNHAGRMELDELHVDQLGPGFVGQGMAVAGVFPAVAGDLVRLADAAGGQDDRLGLEDDESALLAVVAEAPQMRSPSLRRRMMVHSM